ncbi:MAG: histidine kinase [Rhodospirillales bacterium]|nr:histidine kinase [Rhodospirillales bacterium]
MTYSDGTLTPARKRRAGRRRPGTSDLVQLLLVLLSAGGLAVDCTVDTPMAGGVLYIPLVFVGLLRRDERVVWFCAAAAALMTAMGFFLPHIADDLGAALVNRGLSLLAIAIVAVMVAGQVRLIARINAETSRAAAADLAKSHFLQHVSHEMRTPLNAVLGFTELLIPSCRADQADSLAYVGGAARHLMRVVENMLDLAQVDRRPLRVDPVDLGSLIGRVVGSHEVAAAKKTIELQFECAPGACAIGDEWAIRRVIDALLDNAIKFTEPGGTVAVDVRAEAGSVLVHVDDDGIGMGEATRAHLGTPGYDRDPLRTRQGEGLGIGLALSVMLAARMQGAIELDPHRETGTGIALRLPRRT